jgi:hypothetical protein
MGKRYHSPARGIVLMAARCDGCQREVELVGDRAWLGLKRRLSRRPLYCDSCAVREMSRAS